jgi:hypothetical protein
MNRSISSIRTVAGRVALTGSVCALALAGVSAVVAPASASPAAPHGGFTNFLLTSGSASLSGGGHTWNVSVTSIGAGAGVPGVGIEITTPHLGGVETHSWSGILSAGAEKVSSSGTVTIATGSALAPVATLNLTFKPASHKSSSANCLTGSTVVYTGTATGSVSLNTGLKGLKLKGTHLKFGKTSTLDDLSKCVLAPCAWSAWDSSTNGSKAFAGGMIFHYAGEHVIADTYVTNVVTLAGDRIYRIDDFLLNNAPAPKFTKSTKSLSITTGRAGLVTGAVTLAHGKPGSYLLSSQQTCKFNGKVYSVSGTRYSKAKYQVSKPFEAHTILNGVIKVAPQGVADFEIVTLKVK